MWLLFQNDPCSFLIEDEELFPNVLKTAFELQFKVLVNLVFASTEINYFPANILVNSLCFITFIWFLRKLEYLISINATLDFMLRDFFDGDIYF